MAPAASLIPALAMLALASPSLSVAQVLPPPPLPPQSSSIAGHTGTQLRINGALQRARWQLEGWDSGRAAVWLPLEVLQNQLGVSSSSRSDGSLKLEWFGQELNVSAAEQRSLDDEVAIEVSALLTAVGVQLQRSGDVLNLQMPTSQLLGVRSSKLGQQLRVVLDLAAPTLIRRDDERIWLGLSSDAEQRRALESLGLSVNESSDGLRLLLSGTPRPRLFSLGTPARIVIDRLVTGGEAANASALPIQQPRDPRLLALLGRELSWDQQLRGGVRLSAVRVDPRSKVLALRPLARAGNMEGLSSLQQLAARDDALVAINGGFFNRIKRLPLGALRVDGRWLSGPILGRGVMAWDAGSMPRFGRLSLQEWLSDEQGRRLPVLTLNSGYLQRGLSRYTSDWGPQYRALSGQESALVLRANQVEALHDQVALEQGVMLRPGETLVVARGGAALPWVSGEHLTLISRASTDLGQASFVIGGGPLLLQGGQIVLNPTAEGFSPAFVQQGAPRSVLASDGRQLWLLTLEGTSDAGPSLNETAALLQEMGLQDALNLDGGSSTGLVIGGVMTVKGRGVAGAVHNGLGLIPLGNPSLSGIERRSQPTARVR